MGETVDRLVEQYGITTPTRPLHGPSHRKAIAAWKNGAFNAEVVPVEIAGRKGEKTFVTRDERPRADTDERALSRLATVFRRRRKGGRLRRPMPAVSLTARRGGADVGERAEALGVTPLATIVGFASVGVDPMQMALGPTPATRKAISAAGLALSDLDVIEINEAFAGQVLAVSGLLIGIPRAVTYMGAPWLSATPRAARARASSSPWSMHSPGVTAGSAWQRCASAVGWAWLSS